MDRVLLKNTENVVLVLGPFYSDVEGETLKVLDDVTLSRGIAGLALRTMILEIESARREERCKAIFKKLQRKYFEYRSKYRDICMQFGEDSNLQPLWDELKHKDDKLVKDIEKCSVLEGMLRNKEEELEVSRAVEAQCGDLQTQVVVLHRQLEECHLQIDVLHDEITKKQNELDRAKSARSEASRKTEALGW
ncbi:uncharacterized protein [Nicotiana tomentosiformis]|uniref:uncharacterized protein n=1 Tax=Nicotiana tomentosiformis TaxID=4098 RepID=UPI00388CDCE9